MDEVQELGNNLSQEKLETLASIHNGKTRYPVVLLCGGLGTSSTVFGRLGISRFRWSGYFESCLWDLSVPVNCRIWRWETRTIWPNDAPQVDTWPKNSDMPKHTTKLMATIRMHRLDSRQNTGIVWGIKEDPVRMRKFGVWKRKYVWREWSLGTDT